MLKKFLTKSCLLLATLVAFPTSGVAAPVVSGNILSWPADGWYQVQRADTYETVCEGSVSAVAGFADGPCVIDSGSFIVINHTTGERFQNITANDSSSGVDTVVVEGNRISWPDDGWYQVQQADNFVTVCEGGRGCNVEAGRYVVINHTTGGRIEDIIVGPPAQSGNSIGEGVSVVGQQLSWPADGWYQVQDANTYSTVCEGGTGCTVEAGSYVVINHSSGQRFTNIEVTAASVADLGISPTIPATVVVDGNVIRWPADGWYQVQNAQNFLTVCEGGGECAVSPGTYIVINHTNGQRQELEVSDSTVPLNPAESGTTQVRFEITVPAFMSEELQVSLTWGQLNLSAAWVVGESWDVVADLPVNTTNPLLVLFSDRNGAITLGSVETDYSTGTAATETVQITADQFDTARWDNDGDSVSNLQELVFGTDPLSDEYTELDTSFELGLLMVADKTFRFSWLARDDADFYRVLENPDGVSGFSGISGEIDSSIQVYDHRVSLHRRVNAQYIVQACNSDGCVDSETLTVYGSLATASGYFKASNTGDRDSFGRSVILSADGNTMVIAAPYEDSSSTGVNGNQDDASEGGSFSGAVYVFARTNGSWQQQAYIKASNTDAVDYFSGAQILARFNGADGSIGLAIGLSADGNTLAVGAGREDSAATGINGDQSDNSAPDAGAVYVFERNNGVWAQQAYLKASNTEAGDRFGMSLGLSADGNTLVVGAPHEDSLATNINGIQDNNGANETGAAYVFVRNNGEWQQQAYLKAGNALREDEFGGSISLNADGNTLAVAAVRRGYYAGAVYMFERVGGSWQQLAFLQPSLDQQDFFGSSISLSDDGNTMAVGAPGEASVAAGIDGDQSDNSLFFSGAVYLYVRSDLQWRQQLYIKAGDSAREHMFGAAVSLSSDGSTMAVGALRADAVYVYTNRNSSWQPLTTMDSGNWTENEARLFGTSVSLDADGSSLAVGATGDGSAAVGINGNPFDDSFYSYASGAVYLY